MVLLVHGLNDRVCREGQVANAHRRGHVRSRREIPESSTTCTTPSLSFFCSSARRTFGFQDQRVDADHFGGNRQRLGELATFSHGVVGVYAAVPQEQTRGGAASHHQQHAQADHESRSGIQYVAPWRRLLVSYPHPRISQSARGGKKGRNLDRAHHLTGNAADSAPARASRGARATRPTRPGHSTGPAHPSRRRAASTRDAAADEPSRPPGRADVPGALRGRHAQLSPARRT